MKNNQVRTWTVSEILEMVVSREHVFDTFLDFSIHEAI